ncbi:MAG: DUF433 domain-containing protein [Chloroflexi bacterium]|nr:DUF433 domain-containing protein [Chloroflexota bacterium]
MSLVIETEQIPLFADADGVIRIGGTRITLDTLVAAFEDGATPEEIVYQYTSLNLGDVYAAIAYYLRHRQDVEAYLLGRRQAADVIRQGNESQSNPQGVRERLLARRAMGSFTPHCV